MAENLKKYYISAPEEQEEENNKLFSEATELLRCILEDLDITNFTLLNIIEEFNALTEKMGGSDKHPGKRVFFQTKRNNWRQKHLNILLRLGLIERNTSDSYRVSETGDQVYRHLVDHEDALKNEEILPEEPEE